MSFDVEIHQEKDRHLDLSFSCSSMWIFIHEGDEGDIEASYRVPLGALREMAQHINTQLEIYADAKVGPDGEVVK